MGIALRQTPKAVPSLSPRATRLVTELLTVQTQIKSLEEQERALKATLIADVEKAGGTVETEEWKAQRVESESRHIKRELLLQAGVKPSVIAQCTETKPYAYLKVTAKS